jgi:hypothetical protein
LRKLQQRGLSGAYLKVRLFTGALFLLLRYYTRKGTQFVIDDEYSGHSGDIKKLLLKRLRRVDPQFNGDRIGFELITKKSSAHKKALEVSRGDSKPNMIVRADDFLEAL